MKPEGFALQLSAGPVQEREHVVVAVQLLQAMHLAQHILAAEALVEQLLDALQGLRPHAQIEVDMRSWLERDVILPAQLLQQHQDVESLGETILADQAVEHERQHVLVALGHLLVADPEGLVLSILEEEAAGQLLADILAVAEQGGEKRLRLLVAIPRVEDIGQGLLGAGLAVGDGLAGEGLGLVQLLQFEAALDSLHLQS